MKATDMKFNSPSFPLFSEREGRLCRRHNQGEFKYLENTLLELPGGLSEKGKRLTLRSQPL